MKNPLAVFIISVLLLIPGALMAQDEVSLTLDEAVSLALRQNRDVLLKDQDIQKAKAKIAEAKASLFPSLSLNASLMDTRGLYAKDVVSDTEQVTLKQVLYKGGKTVNSIRYNEYLLVIAQALLDKTKLDTVLSVKKGFYTLLLARELTVLNKAIVENTRAHLNWLEERYKKGEASESDMLDIRESLAASEEAYVSALSQLESSSQLLKNLLYLDEGAIIMPNAEFRYEPKELAYDESLLKAMRSRPEIRQYEAQEAASKKAIEVAKADSRPVVSASWDYYGRSHPITGTSRNRNDYNVLGLNLSWPIFDGWLTKAKVEQAIVDLKEARLSREKAIRDISLELKNAYLSFKDAIARLKTAESQIQLYQDRVSGIKQKYGQGIVSQLDLEDVNLIYAVALFNKKEALYDYIIARESFDKATGGS